MCDFKVEGDGGREVVDNEIEVALEKSLPMRLRLR